MAAETRRGAADECGGITVANLVALGAADLELGMQEVVEIDAAVALQWKPVAVSAADSGKRPHF